MASSVFQPKAPPFTTTESTSTTSQLVAHDPVHPAPLQAPRAPPRPPSIASASPLFARPVKFDGHTLYRPEVFYIGLNKQGQAKITRHILDNGGKVSQSPGPDNSQIICLVDANARPVNGTRHFYSVDYIIDCVKRRTRLDRSLYRIVPPRSPGPSRQSNLKKPRRRPRVLSEEKSTSKLAQPNPNVWTTEEDRVLTKMYRNAARSARENNEDSTLRWSIPFWNHMLIDNPILSRRSSQECRERAWLLEHSERPMPNHIAQNGQQSDKGHKAPVGSHTRVDSLPTNVVIKENAQQLRKTSSGVPQHQIVEKVMDNEDARQELDSVAPGVVNEDSANKRSKTPSVTLKIETGMKKDGEAHAVVNDANSSIAARDKERTKSGEEDTPEITAVTTAKKNDDKINSAKETSNVNPNSTATNENERGNVREDMNDVSPTNPTTGNDENDAEKCNTDVKPTNPATGNREVDVEEGTTQVSPIEIARENDEDKCERGTTDVNPINAAEEAGEDNCEKVTADARQTLATRRLRKRKDGGNVVNEVIPATNGRQNAEKRLRSKDKQPRSRKKARKAKSGDSGGMRQAPLSPQETRRKSPFKRQPENSKQARIFAMVQRLSEYANVSQRRAFRALRQERGNWDKAAGLLTRARVDK